MQPSSIPLESRQPRVCRVSRSDLRTHEFRRNMLQNTAGMYSKSYPPFIRDAWRPNTSNRDSLASTRLGSFAQRSNSESLYNTSKKWSNGINQPKKRRLRRGLLLLSSGVALSILLAALGALLLGLLYHPQSTTTASTVITSTGTITTMTTSTTKSTTSVTSSTITTTKTTTTTRSTTTGSTTSTTRTAITSTATTATTSTTSVTTTTMTTTSVTPTTTTTAFSCSSSVTSTLASYTESDCPKNSWHTFKNNFVAPYTGLQTFIFSFVKIFHAHMSLTNVQVHDASNVQLLTNGDFSSSSGTIPTGWRNCSSSGQVASSCSYSASTACYTISTENGTLSQSFSVTSGTNYTISFDMYHNSTAGGSDKITLNVAVV